MKFKKALTLFSVIPMLALTACGGSTTSSATNTSAGETSTVSGDTLEIEFWHTSGKGLTEVYEKYATQFEQLVLENEGKKIDIAASYQGSYDDVLEKINKGFATNNYPNLTVAYPDHVAEYLEAEGTETGKYVVNLEPYIDDETIGLGKESYIGDAGKDDVVKGFYDEGTAYKREGVYSFPVMKSSEIMFYNKELVFEYLPMFDETLSTSSKKEAFLNTMTWTQFMNFLSFVKTYMKNHEDHPGNNIEVPAFYDSDANLMISKMYQNNYPYLSIDDNGKGSVDFNTAENKAFVTTLKANYDAGLITTKGVEKEYGSAWFKEERTLFDIGSSGGSGYQNPTGGQFTVGVCKVPADNNNPLYVSQGVSMAVLKHDDPTGEKAKYAYKFLKYLTSASVNAYLCVNGSEGYIPVRKSAYETSLFLNYLEEGEEGEFVPKVADIVINQIDGHYLNTPCFKGSSTARDAVGSILTRVFKDDATVETAFADAVTETKKAM